MDLWELDPYVRAWSVGNQFWQGAEESTQPKMGAQSVQSVIKHLSVSPQDLCVSIWFSLFPVSLTKVGAVSAGVGWWQEGHPVGCLNLSTTEQSQEKQTKGKGFFAVERFCFGNADADLFCLLTC